MPPKLLHRLRFEFILVLMLCLLVGGMATAQRLEYNVVKGGKVVGKMISDRTQIGDRVDFKITSETKFKMLFSFTVIFESEESYKNGVLVSGSAESTLNGVTQKKAKIWREGYGYESELDATVYTIDQKEITYSVGKIYHEEPNDRTKIYSQNFADFLTIEKSGKHKYVLSSEDGKNIYTFENGICQHVKVSRAYATFYFELVN